MRRARVRTLVPCRRPRGRGKVAAPVVVGGETPMPVFTRRTTAPATIDDAEVEALDRWFRAVNYLAVGQIYLLDNPLLERPLVAEDVKPRLLGHWGTTPGLNLLWTPPEPADPAARRQRDLPGRPRARRPGRGRERLARRHLQRGLPAHRVRPRRDAARCSGSSPSRAASPATSPPRRPARSTRAANSATCSPMPTAPRSTTRTWSWRPWSATASSRPARSPRRGTRNKFVDPVRDGAVLPILHLNGYKIANPTIPARIPREELESAAARLRPRGDHRRGRRPARPARDRWPPWTGPTTGSGRSSAPRARTATWSGGRGR